MGRLVVKLYLDTEMNRCIPERCTVPWVSIEISPRSEWTTHPINEASDSLINLEVGTSSKEVVHGKPGSPDMNS